jgi:hypothetical protein
MDPKPLPYCFSLELPNEPRISNREFLLSYIKFAAWLRLVSAHEQLELLKSSKLDQLRRMAAVATIYEKVGMQMEDLASTFVAWACRARNKDLLLADLLNRIIIVKDAKASGTTGELYADECVEELCAGSHRVRVDLARFFGEVSAKTAVECLRMIGLSWKQVPSVQIARGGELVIWKKLPAALKALVSQLADRSTGGLSALFNKIKHGPQVVVVDLLHAFSKIPGWTGHDRLAESFRAAEIGGETLRVLLDGANTKSSSGAISATVFIDDWVPAIEQTVYRTMFPPTKTMWWIACWIAKVEFGYVWENPQPVLVDFERIAH